MENRCEVEESLEDLWQHKEELKQEIELLAQSHDREASKEAKKPFKKRLDLRRKDLRRVEDTLFHQESRLGYGGSPSSSGEEHHPGTGADVIKSETIITEPEDGAPSVSVTQESAAAPPVEGSAPDMEVDPPPLVPSLPGMMIY